MRAQAEPDAALPALGPDAALLALGHQFEAAWQAEVTAWATLRTDAAGAASDVTNAVVEKIAVLPATTLEGLAVKVRALSWTHEGEPFDPNFFEGDGTMDHRLAASVLADLMKIDGRPLPAAALASEAA